jgi:hypothetical protein
MTDALRAESNRLPILAASINDHAAAADAATRRGLEHAIAAGLLLIEAKELVGHGGWLAWLQASCRVGQRQAQTYMRLARNRHKLEALKNESAAYLTIAAAEALVGRPKPEREHGLPGQLDMLGGPGVITRPAAPVLRSRALFDLITDLEQVHAIIERYYERRGLKHRARLGSITSIITEAITYLKAVRTRRLRRRAPRS